MPIGLGSGCGVKSSTRWPYDRGAYMVGVCGFSAAWAGGSLDAGAVSGFFATLGTFCGTDDAENRSLDGVVLESDLARRGYEALKFRHWQRRHVANGWRAGLRSDALIAFSSIVPDNLFWRSRFRAR